MTEPPLGIVVVGGTSEIAAAIVRELAAARPVRAALIGRARTRLAAAAAALGADPRIDATAHTADLVDVEEAEQVLDEVFGALGRVDVVLVAVGSLGGQAGLDADPAEIAEVLESTFVVAGRALVAAARRLRDRGSGTLVVLSSVAGARIRAGNAVYGAAKAGLDALATGVEDLVAGTDVRVLVVRPGFVVGRMTAGLPTPPLATSPEVVGRATAHALAHRERAVWVPRVMRIVFLVLELLPRGLWRRLPL